MLWVSCTKGWGYNWEMKDREKRERERVQKDEMKYEYRWDERGGSGGGLGQSGCFCLCSPFSSFFSGWCFSDDILDPLCVWSSWLSLRAISCLVAALARVAFFARVEVVKVAC